MFSKPARQLSFVALWIALTAARFAHADTDASRPYAPVAHVADQRVTVRVPGGDGTLPLYADRRIDAVASGVTHVFIIIHGTLRNADNYFAAGQQMLAAAGASTKESMIVAPQFLTTRDLHTFAIHDTTLAWSEAGWKAGDPARRPSPVSSFAALDALLEHFDNRQLYPALSTVTVIGHSAGAQVVQRYAVAGRAEDVLTHDGIRVRYVVANPSSYVYFDDLRPTASGAFARVDTQACPRAVEWKYGMADAPAYVAAQDSASLEARYASRDVIYLLGMDDVDPHTHFIDRSCAAMAQGPFRLARGLAYFDYLTHRYPAGLNQRVVKVPGLGHDGRRMLTSACGVAALFDRPMPAACPVESATPRRSD
ncbi:alpha/beta hydrolase [Paraburkholderia sp. Tr-20389]|uniref:alpha/beta hydrolase n=1 Tax=Paraburkholderia sp. Tr-20389 TaxID=2703903 RepID=UPI00197FDDBC|nr:alpha/beta hydrolase [Paraburkholderia sp. Tr-20389]MBN3753208.1 alpha/beta hydrolase [Paraburkholderia sp. Tr-20389]